MGGKKHHCSLLTLQSRLRKQLSQYKRSDHIGVTIAVPRDSGYHIDMTVSQPLYSNNRFLAK